MDKSVDNSAPNSPKARPRRVWALRGKCLIHAARPRPRPYRERAVGREANRAKSGEDFGQNLLHKK